MTAETAAVPETQKPEIRVEKPGITVIEPLDVEVDIYVPMPVKSVRLGKLVPRMVKAEPCIILDGVFDDE